MATDTLEIFGTEYTGVTGIKATDDQSGTKVYIRPQGTKSISANGTGIDVAEYASVDVSVPSSGVDIPVFTASWNQNYELISASCSETFAQCYARYNNSDVSAYYHGIFDVDGDSWDGYYSLTVRSANSNEIVYTYFYGAYPASDIVYRSNGQINFVDTSSARLTLNVTSNGDYYPSDGVYTEVHVSVPSGSSKNAQIVQSTTRTNASTLTAIGAELTVSKTGTYDIYYSCFRTNTSSSYTWATRLYINGTAYGTAENATWTNNQQNTHLSNISLTDGDKLRVYGRNTRGTSYYICAPMLVIIEA